MEMDGMTTEGKCVSDEEMKQEITAAIYTDLEKELEREVSEHVIYTILLGQGDDGDVYTATLDTTGCAGNRYFSISGNAYDSRFFTSEQGEEQARQYIADNDDIWKQAVASGHTTASLKDFNDDILNDGWEQLLGGVLYIAEDLHTLLNSYGCLHSIYKPGFKWKTCKLAPSEIKTLNEATNSKHALHLKNMTAITQADKTLLHKVMMIFKTRKRFNSFDLMEYNNPHSLCVDGVIKEAKP